MGQVLYATKLRINAIKLDGERNKTEVAQINELLKESIDITRDISSELSPSVLKDFGLKIAIKEMAERFKTSHLKISTSVSGFDARINSTVELSLYRIIQELLNNMAKHAKATKASIELTAEEDLIVLEVRDNGIGIAEKELGKITGLGLHSIRNRVDLLGGNMEIKSGPGKGTVFKFRFKH